MKTANRYKSAAARINTLGFRLTISMFLVTFFMGITLAISVSYFYENRIIIAEIFIAVLIIITIVINTFFTRRFIISPVRLMVMEMENRIENAVDEWKKSEERNKKNLHEIKHLEKKAEAIYFDALTGLYNRRYLDEELKNILKYLSRSSGCLTLMMIDIDRFKQYNDTYGHYQGDKCLKLVAEILLKSTTRDVDFTVRYGGEEFTIVLPNTDEKGAHIIAEKILENIRNENIPHANNDSAPHLTVSIGVVSGKVTYMQCENDYLIRSDEMLYVAKQNGRNGYKFASIG